MAAVGSASLSCALPSMAAEADSGPANNSVLTITSVRDGSCLGVADNSMGNGARAQAQKCGNTAFQQWRALKDGNGDYQLVNAGSGLCLDLPYGSKATGTAIQQWGCGDWAWHKWHLGADGHGHYVITSAASGLALDEDLYSTTGGVIQWTYAGTPNQQWQITGDVKAPGNGPVGFGARTTGGGRAQVVTVTRPDQLAAALCSTRSNDGFCTDDTPRVIRISGMLDFRGSSGTTTAQGCGYSDRSCSVNGKAERILKYANYCDNRPTFNITYDTAGGYSSALLIGSNKTVLGSGANSGIVGKGLAIKGGVSNIIIRNLSITDINDGVVWAGDAITIDNGSKIWIDHNYFARIGRQMIVTGWGTAKNVTISANHFDGTTEYGHFCNGRDYWVMLLNGQEQTITVAGNRIHNTSGRSPELGGSPGGIIHLVNNFYDNNYFTGGLIGNNEVAALAEGNYFGKCEFFFPIFDTTDNKTDSHSNWNFAPVAGNLARANAACVSTLGRNCEANVDNNGKDGTVKDQPSVFLLNPAAMSRIQGFKGAADAIRAVTPIDAASVPNLKFGPQANIGQ